MLDFIEKRTYIVSFFLTFIVFNIILIVIGVEPFGTRKILIGDSLDQYMPFFCILKDKLETFQLSVHNFSYSWKVGLGANFLLLYFYYLASPLNILVLLVSKEHIVGLLTILVVLKVSFASSTFSYYLAYKSKKREGRNTYDSLINLAFSFSYGFSGYICGYYWNIMWLDTIVLLPLVIIGLELLIDKKKPIIYIISLWAVIYTNFYTGFMVCIFLGLYFLLYKHLNVKSFFGSAIRFTLSSLLSAGMSALSLLVIYFGIGHTMTADYAAPSIGFFGNIFYSLRQAFFLTKPVTVDEVRYNGYANIYSGTVVLLLFFIYLLSNKESVLDKLRKIALVLILFISFNEKVLNYIWHGFHEQFLIPNRFSFLYIFVLISIAYDCLKDIKTVDKKNMLIAVGVSFLSPLVCYVFVDFDCFISPQLLIVINMILMLVYGGMLLCLRSYEKSHKVIYILLVAFVYIELSINAFLSFKTVSFEKDLSSVYSLDEMIQKSKENDIYREDVVNPDLSNENAFLNINGASTFCSTISGDSVYTMMDLGYRGLNNQYNYQGYTPITDSLLGIKNIYWYDGNGPHVYSNDNALPIGYAVKEDLLDYQYDKENNSAKNINNIVSLSSGESISVFESVSDKMEIIGHDVDIRRSQDMFNSVYLKKKSSVNGILELRYNVEETGTYYLYMRATNYDNLQVYVNDKLYASGAIFNGLLEIPMLEAGSTLDVFFETSADTPLIWYLDRYNGEAADAFLKKLSTRGVMIDGFREGDAELDIDIGEGEMLLLSIPYDKGWNVYDGNEKVDIQPAIRGLTAIKLHPGRHVIRLKYVPEGYISGLIISLLSWIVFMIMVLMSYYKQHENSISFTSKKHPKSKV